MADKVLCAKPCALQQADKSYLEGMIYVYLKLVRYVPKGGTANQKLEVATTDITGMKQSKANPLLMLQSSQISPVLRFQTQQDRNDIAAAITQAQTQQQAAAQAAAMPAAPTASIAAGAGGQSATQKLKPEERQALLENNPGLSAQFKTLVLEHKALTEEEFWSSSAMLKVAGVAGKPVSLPRSSRMGLANRLVDLAKQSKAADEKMTRLAMTEDDEVQMLCEKPVLRQIYDAQVPTMISREEFWQRYFRYIMAKREKRGGALKRYKAIQQSLTEDSAAAVADMTGKQQQQELLDYELSALFSALDGSSGLDSNARSALKRRLNPTVDLAAAAEDRLTADGYGIAHNSARSELEQVQGYSAMSQQLAQDYNVHAAAVMGLGPSATAAGNSRPGSSAAAAAAAAAAAGGGPGGDGLSEMSEEELQRCRRQAGGSGLEDLSAPVQQQFEELRVTNPRLYFSHTQPQQQQPASQQSQPHDAGWQQPGSAQQQQQQQDVVSVLRSIDCNALTDRPMQPAVANKVLVELCGGDVADAVRTGGTSAMPKELLTAMQQQAMLVDELLRHFWSLLPVNTQAKQDKLERIQPALVQRGDYLKQLQDNCPPGYKVSLSRLIRPLKDQLDTANKGYQEVQKQLALKKQQKKAGRP